MSSQQLAIIAGVGSGTGASLARRFASKYTVILLARKPSSYQPVEKEVNESGGKAHGISTDISNPESVKAAFEEILTKFPNASVQTAIFNASGMFVRKPLLDITMEDMDAGLGVSVRGALLFAQTVLPLLLNYPPSHQIPPSLFFTGSTAAIKANPTSAVMCVPRHGLRALAISAAKEFGPKGVHVVHVIVDGAIDTPWGQPFLRDKPLEERIDPEGIAQMYWDLHLQGRKGFTFEVDVRGMGERW